MVNMTPKTIYINELAQKREAEKRKKIQASSEYARTIIEKSKKNTNFDVPSERYPRFSLEEIQLGRLLGKGGYAFVFEIRGFSDTPDDPSQSGRSWSSKNRVTDVDDPEVKHGFMESRQFIAENCIRNGGDARYAMKIVRKDLGDDPATLSRALVDMGLETLFLSVVEHPNIVRLRAISDKPPYDPTYFIILDRLYDTLKERMEVWKRKNRVLSGRLTGMVIDRSGKKKAALYESRLSAAYSIADAVRYLHDRNILYRDLKPENMGFDIRDEIKIFDFGLAKELREEDRNEDGTYRLTGMTGSLRYMAPEVSKTLPYNASCDVYSFGILLWEIISLRVPFEFYTRQSLHDRVCNSPYKRPQVTDAWPVTIRQLLEQTWCPQFPDRLSMREVTEILRRECLMVHESTAALDDSRSTSLKHQASRSARSSLLVAKESGGISSPDGSTDNCTVDA